MDKYTIYCTKEQTMKAIELGAPIRYKYTLDNRERGKFETPTAEQMINWLEEQGLNFEGSSYYMSVEIRNGERIDIYSGTRKEATLAAIDNALEYLISKKGE